jgi:hypothetical protein
LSKKDQADLLGELCTKLGYCSLSEECEKMLDRTPLTVDEFVDAVIEGESGESGESQSIHRQVKDLVASYYDVATNHGLWFLKFPENRPDGS